MLSTLINLADQITFTWPWIFILLPLPGLVYYFVPATPSRHYRLKVAGLRVKRKRSSGSKYLSHNIQRLLLGCWLWLLLLLSASHPQWIGNPVPLPNKGHDLMLAVDISGSMQMQDMRLDQQPTDRLTAVKKIVSDFVLRREGDRLGLIVFGSQAYLHVPLSHDRSTVSGQLIDIQLRMAGEQTAIGDAIALAVKRLKNQPEDARVLILLTDGANTSGEIDPLQAAQLAASQKLKIYTIGIGADELEVETLFGLSRRINPSQELDEYTLRTLAKKTGGQYFRARSTEELNAIYQELDRLEPIEQQSQVFRPRYSLLHWPLSLAIISLMMVFSGRWLLTLWRQRHQGQSQQQENSRPMKNHTVSNNE